MEMEMDCNLTKIVSRGEKGILAHPQRPPNFNEIAIFVHFFLLKPTENKITPKKLLTHPDRTRSHPRSHVDRVFPCSNSTENKVISKISFTYAIKQNFEKIPQNFQFVFNRGRWGFPPESPFLPY